MLVKDLIEALATLDPNMPVVSIDYEYAEVTTPRPAIVGMMRGKNGALAEHSKNPRVPIIKALAVDAIETEDRYLFPA